MRNFIIHHRIITALLLCLLMLGLVIGGLKLVYHPSSAPASAQGDPLDQYNVNWYAPSTRALDSMPLGNGDIGLNVWVQGGDLLFYIGKTDTWDDWTRLLKPGLIRVHLQPNLLRGTPFLQTLRLRQGEIQVQAGVGKGQVTLLVWVDANHPVIHVETSSQQPFSLTVTQEDWRTKARTLDSTEADSAYGVCSTPMVNPDVFQADQGNQLVWYHRNTRSEWPALMQAQGLGSLSGQFSDPYLDRTFGGLIKGTGLTAQNTTTLGSTRPVTQSTLSIYLLTQQTATSDAWLQQLHTLVQQVDAVPLAQARQAHERWWSDFWNRSWIRVGNQFTVSQAYLLQRFMTAGAGRGNAAIKFNGSIFNVDSEGSGDADYRRWGPNYWFQNTRLIYWPLLASGDVDLMQPFFKQYLAELPLVKARTQLTFGHAGAAYYDLQSFWGGIGSCSSPDQVNSYMHYYWSDGLELLALMIDEYNYTHDQSFLGSTLLPSADAILQFYDLHYKVVNGVMDIEPAQALEQWANAVDPLPEIAGLQFDLKALLALPDSAITSVRRTTWQHLLEKVPPLPTGQINGRTVLLPARQYSHEQNIENPALYAVFPYRIFGVGKTKLQLAQDTFAQREFKQTGDWRQDAIQAALLGDASTASQDVSQNFSETHSAFPAIWGPSLDWIPDEDQGGVAQMALQEMLLQTGGPAEGNKIMLFPAWPKDWDVDFKLHAPLNTTIQDSYHNGVLQNLVVTPSSRRADVTVMLGGGKSGAITGDLAA